MSLIIPTRRQSRYFEFAKKQALSSTYARHKSKGIKGKVGIGAVIIKGNFIVSTGVNKIKTHTQQHRHNMKYSFMAPTPRMHAEVDALISSRFYDLTGCEVFVYRENSDGGLANCRPCAACLGALTNAGVKHFYYTTDEGYHHERH